MHMGVYGFFLGDGKAAELNHGAGHLLRAKVIYLYIDIDIDIDIYRYR